jgi:hypothetical protein
VAPGVSAVQAALKTPLRKKGKRRKKKSPSFGSGSPAFHLAFLSIPTMEAKKRFAGLVMNRESERKLLEKFGKGVPMVVESVWCDT